MNELRAREIQNFLARTGWGDADRATLAGDASARRYERLRNGPDGAGAVLMDAPRGKGGELQRFMAIADHLRGLGLSPPRVIAADIPAGLALLEDLGDALFSQELNAMPSREAELYLAATDVLAHLHTAPPPEAPPLGAAQLTDLIDVAYDWYGLGATGHVNEAARTEAQTLLARAFNALAPERPVLVLRDYHAENLFWLADRSGLARVGLIDFQDAGIGHPAYDLVSLARDVRRDVRRETVESMTRHFCEATGRAAGTFAQAMATISAQRNLRILGVFARLSLHYGKPEYVDFIPRTWTILMEDLAHPDLARLKHHIENTLPAPDPSVLSTLKEKCATFPNP